MKNTADKLAEALEIIAGRRQCLNMTLSDVEIARQALTEYEAQKSELPDDRQKALEIAKSLRDRENFADSDLGMEAFISFDEMIEILQAPEPEGGGK